MDSRKKKSNEIDGDIASSRRKRNVAASREVDDENSDEIGMRGRKIKYEQKPNAPGVNRLQKTFHLVHRPTPKWATNFSQNKPDEHLFLISKGDDFKESTYRTDGSLPSYSFSPSSITIGQTACIPSHLFRTISRTVGTMETDGPVDKLATSKEFAQLPTLPISENSPPGKEYDFVYNSRKHFIARAEKFKEDGDGFKPPSPKRMKSDLHGNWNSSPSNLLLKIEDNSSTNNITKSFHCLPSENSSFAVFGRSNSESAVKDAVEQNSTGNLLVGDSSHSHVLPVINKRTHRDLKKISSSTVVDVISGKYGSQIKSFIIVDCRFPYEFEGGHIIGAINLYTEKQIYSRFIENKLSKSSNDVDINRNIIIFHCEFSSSRAPNLCRYLRSIDQLCNASTSPALHYPELYVLFGGYKNFFEKHAAYCDPMFYRTMRDVYYRGHLKLYKNKCVSELVLFKKKSSM